jgi:uncharacterized membrane protein YGL010W
MLCPPLPSAKLVDDWVERHRYPPSLACHLVGIPVSVLGVLLVPVFLALASWRVFLLSLGLFAAGYTLQFLGHLFEWTEPGEITGLRLLWERRLGKAAPVSSTDGAGTPGPSSSG